MSFRACAEAKDTQFVLTQGRLPWLGLQAVKTPSTSCESCQALSALFPVAGARAANTAKKKTVATNVATTEFKVQKKARLYAVYETAAGDSGCVLGFSCCARKAQASPFDIKPALAGRTLTPMPPAGGELTGELRHKPETHVGAAICSAAWGASCRRVRFCRLPAHPWRSVPHKRHARPPWRREENRTINFTWVILFGHSKTNFDSQNGRKDVK